MTKYRTIWIPLFSERFTQTDGNTAERFFDLDMDLGSVFLHAEDVAIVCDTRQRMGNFAWNIVFWPGWDRNSEGAMQYLFGSPGTAITSSGPERKGAYANTGFFQPHARIGLMTQNTAGSSTVQSAIISAGLLVKLWGV